MALAAGAGGVWYAIAVGTRTLVFSNQPCTEIVIAFVAEADLKGDNTYTKTLPQPN
jgi:hypothetical protein